MLETLLLFVNTDSILIEIHYFYKAREGEKYMDVKMSAFLQKNKKILKELVRKLSEDFDYVSVLGTDTKGTTYSVRGSGTNITDSMWNERGFVVRVFNGINYSEYSFNNISESNIDKITEDIRASVYNQLDQIKKSSVNMDRYRLIEEENCIRSFYGNVQIPIDHISEKEKIEMLTAIRDKAFQHSEYVVDFQSVYNEAHVSKLFISAKKDMEQSYIWSEGYLIPIVRKDNVTKYSFQCFSGLKGVELIDEMKGMAEKAVDGALELLDAQQVEPGEYECICTPEVAGIIAHEAFGHGVEMDMVVKERAKSVEYFNKSIASELVTMHDGAAAAQQVSSYLFDDEGTLSSDTVIIENGILKTGLCDMLSALKLGLKPTGNGKRQSYERKAYARMTNTFFSQGKDSLKDMIASIKHGYLLDGGMSGMEDPKNWGIQCMLTKGYEIADGKLTGKIIAPVIVTGYVPDLLKSISMVSDDLSLYGSGACGKGYKEFVKVSDGGPYIKAKVRLG